MLKANLIKVSDRITQAAKRAGRDADDVKLVAVTKYVDAETTRDLVNSGCAIVGESRPQLFKDKHEKMSDLDIQWHLIGHLQRNKIKFVLPQACLIHSVDSMRLLEAIESHSEKTRQNAHVLLEVNISGESNKHGFQEHELIEALRWACSSQWVYVDGLMGMSRLGGSPDEVRGEFRRLRELRDELSPQFQDPHVQLKELSMGMTGDFEVAIEEGATLVRIGSALFDGVM